MRITPFQASTFSTDGGAFFGLVPQPLWSRHLTPDARNRLAVNTNALLIELEDGRRGLVETGVGSPERFSDKERDIHQLPETWPLVEFLGSRGLESGDIDFIVHTHLHWDHAGGAGIPDGNGRIRPTFPNATHYVHQMEWLDAVSGDPLLHKSYPPDVIEPFHALPQGPTLIQGDDEAILPGIRMVRSGGHTRGHCVILLRDDGLEIDHPEAQAFESCREVVVTGDVCPTQFHIPLVFQTAYDTYPLDTRRWKLHWLPQVALESMGLLFTHDPRIFGATLRLEGRGRYGIDQALPQTTP